MQILGHADDHACVLRSEGFTADINVDGIGPETLRSWMGAGGARTSFPLTLKLSLQAAPASADIAFARTFAEGSIHGASGGGAHVALSHHDPRFMMPQPFGFALAQQWARAGLIALHAAVVSVGGRGVLALGRRGSGKSVLSASALAAGGHAVSDDWVLVGVDPSGALRAERLRAYLQLHDGGASSALRGQLGAHEPWRAQRSKRVLSIDPAHAAFPQSTPLAALWVLKRPDAGRLVTTRCRTAPQAIFFAQLLDASVAALLAPPFVHERDALRATIDTLLRRLTLALVEPGSDLVDAPASAWSALQQ
jgi:hypothetical protein